MRSPFLGLLYRLGVYEDCSSAVLLQGTIECTRRGAKTEAIGSRTTNAACPPLQPSHGGSVYRMEFADSFCFMENVTRRRCPVRR